MVQMYQVKSAEKKAIRKRSGIDRGSSALDTTEGIKIRYTGETTPAGEITPGGGKCGY